MRKILLFAAVAACVCAQTTPNIGLQLPPRGSSNWNVPLNYNFALLDQILAGIQPIPALSVTGALSAPNLTLSSTSVTNALGYTPMRAMVAIASMPSAGLIANQVVWVKDGISASDCTSGLGNFAVACISNGTSYAALSVGNAGGGGGGTGTPNAGFSFTAQTTVTLAHGMGTLNTLAECYDTSGNEIWPGQVVRTDVNNTTVRFLAPTTGTCVVNGTGGTSSGGGGGTATVTEYVDMSTKGVVADGSTDNYTAIMAQVNLVAANADKQNRVLYFPAGTYAISAKVILPSKVIIRGNHPGDMGAGGTSFQPTGGFPSGTTMFQIGTSTALAQNTGLESLTVACNNIAGSAFTVINGQEGVHASNLNLIKCPDTGFRVKGSNSCGLSGGCTGWSEHDGDYHDMQIYSSTASVTTTTCFDVQNDLQLRGIYNITCTATGGSLFPTYGAKLSCSNCSVHGIHFENFQNGIKLGESGTVGVSDLFGYDIDGTVNVSGNVIELETNPVNSPQDLFLMGINGGGLAIKNLAYPAKGDCHTSMIFGQQSGGDIPVQCWDYATFNAGGGGGGGGGVTSLNGQTGAITLPTISPTGCGASVTGTTTLSINALRKPDTSQPTTVPVADQCGAALFYTSVTSVGLPQAGLAGNFANGTNFTIYNNNAGSMTISPTGSTIQVNRGAAGSSYTLTTLHSLAVFSDGTNYIAFDK